MLANNKIRCLAENKIEELIDNNRLPKGSEIGKSSGYYLVKLKYDGPKHIELYGLTNVDKPGVTDFGWVLLGFSDERIGEQLIPLTSKSKWIHSKPLYSTYIERFGVTTNVARFIPQTKYENVEVSSATKNKLVLRSKESDTRWIIKRGSGDDNMKNLADFIRSKQADTDTHRTNVYPLTHKQEEHSLFLGRAARLVAEKQRASTALFQRELKIGYARAAKLMADLEHFGIVSEANGADPRIVYVKNVKEALEKLGNNTCLRFEIGQDENGNHFVADFCIVGHFISSGHVGSGHASFDEGAFVTGLIQDYSAEELKFIMIDPKYVQLTMYKSVPHLLRPVIHTPDEAKDAVQSLVREMESRLDILSKAGVESIVDYNQKSDKRLPYIILLIPEIADLMMVDNEYYTSTFSQFAAKSHTVGIHMYLATQRPSSRVLPDALLTQVFGRLIFGVASEVDNERLLSGYARADQLEKLGELYYMDQAMQPIKLQAAFVSSDQTKSIVKSVIEAS